jgi:TolB protein
LTFFMNHDRYATVGPASDIRYGIYLTIVILSCIIRCLLPVSAAAQSDVYMAVRAGGSGLIAIGVGGFDAQGERHPLQAVRLTIESDFRDCGLFETRALTDSTRSVPGGLFEQWKAAGASFFLYGESRDSGETVSARLVDLDTGLEATSGNYRVDSERPRLTAHVIVDDIIRHFTGMQGSMATEIAFIRTIGTGNELFVIGADGMDERQITFSRTLNLSPSWSADGSRIAYSALNVSNWLIMMTDINTGQSIDITQWPGLNTAPEWSPISQEVIAFTSNRDGNPEIYTCRIDGSGLRRLTNHRLIDTSPTWSPDGSQIAYSSDRAGNPHVYVMNSDGTGSRRLTSLAKSYEDSPCWSPRGDRIAFVITSDWGFDIATSSPSGDDVVMLTFGQGSNENPSWSPDGLRIVFTSDRTGTKRLYIMNGDGSNQRPLTRKGQSFSPAWAPSVSGGDIRIIR